MNIIRKYNIRNISVTLFIFFCFFVSACGHKSNQERKDKTQFQVTTDAIDSVKNYKVTFIELGSVRCIPCRQMQAVMESVKAKYGNEV